MGVSTVVNLSNSLAAFYLIRDTRQNKYGAILHTFRLRRRWFVLTYLFHLGLFRFHPVLEMHDVARSA